MMKNQLQCLPNIITTYDHVKEDRMGGHVPGIRQMRNACNMLRRAR